MPKATNTLFDHHLQATNSYGVVLSIKDKVFLGASEVTINGFYFSILSNEVFASFTDFYRDVPIDFLDHTPEPTLK